MPDTGAPERVEAGEGRHQSFLHLRWKAPREQQRIEGAALAGDPVGKGRGPVRAIPAVCEQQDARPPPCDTGFRPLEQQRRRFWVVGRQRIHDEDFAVAP